MEILVYYRKRLRKQGTDQGWASGEDRGADGARSIIRKFGKDI